MTREFPLADVGEGLTEAELVRWLVAVGDTIDVNDPVCEVETAKSIVELPSPYAGTVEALLVGEGDTVPVGTPLLRIAEGSPSHAEGSPSHAEGSPSPVEEQPLTLVGSGPKQQAVTRRMRRTDPSARRPDPSARQADPSPVTAKPGARLAARERGIDLKSVSASRSDGVITVDDLEQGGGLREPVRGVRKAMAEAMTASNAVPQVTVWTTVDATRTLELVARLKRHRDFDGVRVTPLVVVAKACLLALRRTPLLNSTYDGDAVVLHDHVNLGIAAATPRGLVVPQVKGADGLSLVALAGAIQGLVATARDGRTQPADQAGGTFTITNVGPFGMEGGTPLLNPGESGILCLGAIARRPWVVADADGAEEIRVRDVVTLALTFDHRHIDGETGSRFLADVAAVVEDPATALLL